MAKGDVFHALKHAYRQNILRTLRRRPRTYSTLLAKVEPDGEGTGSFNYHLKVLKDAGLVEVDDGLYRTTPSGSSRRTQSPPASAEVIGYQDEMAQRYVKNALARTRARKERDTSEVEEGGGGRAPGCNQRATC